MLKSVRTCTDKNPPSIDELVERARALKPALAQRAAMVEKAGRVPAESISELKQAGLLSLMRPVRYGGFALPPSATVRIGFELGQACGSTAWCTMVGNTCSWYTAYWPIDVQDAIWGSNPQTLVAGAFAPTGKCVETEGGYLLSGQWPFASNCDNSEWVMISAMVPVAEGEAPTAGWFMVESRSLLVDDQSWDVSGLQGTGSKTVYVTEPLFVPRHHLVRVSDVLQLTTPGNAIADNKMARFAFSTFGATCLAASLLGMAQGALNCFIETMQAKVRVPLRAGAPTSPAHNPFTQARIGAASAAIDAAMALVLTDLERLEAQVESGIALTDADRVTARRNAGFAAQQAVMAADMLYEGAGASSSSRDSPIQRFWRDVKAGARHVTLDVEAINSMVGRERFGLPIAGQY